MPLNNFGLVQELASGAKLWRCAQPDKDGFTTLVRLGVQHVIKLNDNLEYPDETERSLFAGQVWSMPYPRLFFIPRKSVILATVRTIRQLLESGNSVAVHCTHGVDRTCLVVAAYRMIVCGHSFPQVQKERYLFGASAFRDIPDHAIVEFLKSL